MGHTLKNRWDRLSPASLLCLYYLVAILAGSLLLRLPWAVRGAPLSWLDALFTATSAQCVTGLIVVDTGTRFSLFGQCVILGLIQIGGLGITTFSVYLFAYLKQRVSLRGRWFIQETLLHTPVDSLASLVRRIILFTLTIEAVGALLLAIAFVPRLGWADGLFSALFHSVSAFCNAGFSLFPDSLVGFRADPLVNLTIMALIVLGGLGFLVMDEFWQRWRTDGPTPALSLHSRVVVWTTLGLILVGTLLFAGLERGSALQGMPITEGFWTALFQSVTARTAGFNTIDLQWFEVPSLFLMMLLMFVGASPGSSGGGIKTTSLVIFLAALGSRLRGQRHTNLTRRTLPEEAVTKVLTLVMLSMVTLAVAILALLTAELSGVPEAASGSAFIELTFEAVSAFATVGLSLGVTPHLGVAGKLILVGLMFAGRVGILTVGFVLIRHGHRLPVRYGEENIMIG